MANIAEFHKINFASALESINEGIKALHSAVYEMNGPERDEMREIVVEVRNTTYGEEVHMTTPFIIMEIMEVAQRLQEMLKG